VDKHDEPESIRKSEDKVIIFIHGGPVEIQLFSNFTTAEKSAKKGFA
jgi:hypothetical protein